MRLERGLLTRAELFRAAGAGAVMQAVRSLSIEALDGIVQSLTLHAGQPGGLGPGHALERIGDRQQPRAGPGVPLRAARWRGRMLSSPAGSGAQPC